LIKINGIGNAKASKIMAALELGKRASNLNLNNVILNNSKVIFEHYKNYFIGKKQEYFYVIYLDSRKRLLKEKLLFIGTINQSIVHPREIFKEAFNVSATSIICIHNHPAGSITPSRNDRETTMTIKSIGKTMGINLDDHIIIGDNAYYSFFDDGKL
jgi:DNA repair protein RadC